MRFSHMLSMAIVIGVFAKETPTLRVGANHAWFTR